jgi:hypothetical protein
MKYEDPYIKCPVIENDRFLFRLVEESDAKELLSCYSDRASVKLFNSDNCPIDFYFDSLDELTKLIQFWLREYGESGYVRFAIMDKTLKKVIGTIEIFAKKDMYKLYHKVGLLRVDLASKYETNDDLDDIFALIDDNFAQLFGINSLLTKAIPVAKARIKLLESRGYTLLDGHELTNYDDYYIKLL